MSINLEKYQIPVSKLSNEVSQSTENSWQKLLNKDIQLWGKQLSIKKRNIFYTELGILLNAGLDLKTSLDLIEESQVNSKDKRLFTQIKTAVIQGMVYLKL